MSRERVLTGRLPNLVASLPANVREAPQSVQDVAFADGTTPPTCPWPIEDILRLAKTIPLRKTRKELTAQPINTMGMHPGAVQLLQVLCMGMGASLNLHQNQSAPDPLNITMMQPKERGLKSLLRTLCIHQLMVVKAHWLCKTCPDPLLRRPSCLRFQRFSLRLAQKRYHPCLRHRQLRRSRSKILWLEHSLQF